MCSVILNLHWTAAVDSFLELQSYQMISNLTPIGQVILILSKDKLETGYFISVHIDVPISDSVSPYHLNIMGFLYCEVNLLVKAVWMIYKTSFIS